MVTQQRRRQDYMPLYQPSWIKNAEVKRAGARLNLSASTLISRAKAEADGLAQWARWRARVTSGDLPKASGNVIVSVPEAIAAGFELST